MKNISNKSSKNISNKSSKNITKDGLLDLKNRLSNSRNILNNATIISNKLTYTQLREAYKTGIVNKIIRLKTTPLLDNTIDFKDDVQECFYHNRIETPLKETLRYMLAFGRGVLMIYRDGEDLSKPFYFQKDELQDLQIRAFSGDMVSTLSVDFNINSYMYNKPLLYTVNGFTIHHSRIVDFTYVKPSVYDLPNYNYGGISETELIYNQLINDAIVERATANIIDKSSNFVYSIKDFNQKLATGQDCQARLYFHTLENIRNTSGAIVIDKEDDVKEVNQSLTNLSETDIITIKRIAMVTSIPVSRLTGESPNGLNATGEVETDCYHEMLLTLQREYLLSPLNNLFSLLGFEPIKFKINQWLTPLNKIKFDREVLTNMQLLQSLGEDYQKYGIDYGIIKEKDYTKEWVESLENDTDKENN